MNDSLHRWRLRFCIQVALCVCWVAIVSWTLPIAPQTVDCSRQMPCCPHLPSDAPTGCPQHQCDLAGPAEQAAAFVPNHSSPACPGAHPVRLPIHSQTLKLNERTLDPGNRLSVFQVKDDLRI